MYDDVFPTRLELFYRLVRDYTTSFTLNFNQRRDPGFHVYRELSQFLFNVGRRRIRPANLPAENNHQGVLKLSIPDVKALTITDFLSRSELDSRLDIACKAKTDAEKGEKKKEGLTLEAISNKYKEEFGRTARSYVIFLFKGTQMLTRFSSSVQHDRSIFLFIIHFYYMKNSNALGTIIETQPEQF